MKKIMSIVLIIILLVSVVGCASMGNHTEEVEGFNQEEFIAEGATAIIFFAWSIFWVERVIDFNEQY